jgi:FkbM family methyltransferase
MTQKAYHHLARVTRALKRVPGAVLVLEHFRRSFARCRETMQVHDFDGSLTLNLCLDEHMQSQIFWYGYYSRDIVLVLDRLLSPGMVVLDVGANIGEISLCAGKRVGANGDVFSFEPMPAIHQTLQQNISLNSMLQIHPIEMGIADAEGEAKIYSADSVFKDGTRHLGLGTLYPMNSRTTLAAIIKLTTIDAFVMSKNVKRVDLIQVDAEGAELKALIGAENTLKRFKPVLILELQKESSEASGCSPHALLDYLEKHGYVVFSIGRKAKLRSLDKHSVEPFQNILCLPSTDKS